MKTALRRAIFFGIVLLLAVAAIAMVPITASAQTRIFLNMGDIKGGSMDEFHKDWIEVLSLRQAYPPAKRSPCQLEVVKGLDVAGPDLWAAAVKGTHIPESVVEVTPLSDTSRKIYEIKLKEVQVISIVTYGGPGSTIGDTGGGQTFAETVTLSSGSVELTYYRMNPDGSSGGQEQTKFNCN